MGISFGNNIGIVRRESGVGSRKSEVAYNQTTDFCFSRLSPYDLCLSLHDLILTTYNL